MKKPGLILIIILFGGSLFAQVSEGRSGVQTLNISRNKTQETQLPVTRTTRDDIPPVIIVTSPDQAVESARKSSEARIIVKGKVDDAGGVFEVLVNEVNAKVATDGSFLAEIPLNVGKNPVTVKATDISLNRSSFTFIYEREAEVVTVVPPKPVNIYSIKITSPSEDHYITASDKFNLQACITGTAPIRRVMITRNGNFVNGFFVNNNSKKDNCDFFLDEPLSLRLGMNDLKIEVFADDDTIIRSVTVDYSLYAARNFALLIGNQNYDDPQIPELEEPVKDIDELYNVLTKQYNFLPGNVIMLKNSTKAEIIGKLHELRSLVNPLDNLLIFYAGHGYWDEGMGVGYWLPKDAAKNNPVNWIPNTDLTNYLGAIKTKHTLLIADACFSGGIFKTRALGETFAIEMLYQLNSRKAITSGNLKEVPDQSVFFQYFIKNLKENTNDYLSSEELFSKMKLAVMNNSPTVPQFGTIQNVGDEGGDFIFIKRK